MGTISRKRNRQSAPRTLPSQKLRRVFYFPKQGSFEISRLEGRNGRPGSRGSRRRGVCPSARGLSEGTRRKPDTDDRVNLFSRFAIAAHRSRAAHKHVSFSGLPRPAAKPTLVVKISDTSLQWKKRVRIPPVKSRTVERPPARDPARATAPARPSGLTGVESLRPISPVPQRAYSWPTRKLRSGGGEDACYFVSKTVPARAATASSVPRLLPHGPW